MSVSVGSSCDYFFSILILGNFHVGKTWLIQKFLGIPYDDRILGSFEKHEITIGDTRVGLLLWDMFGDARFPGLTTPYYKQAQGIMLLYSIEDRESFLTLKVWLDGIKKFAHPATVITLLGTKCDKVLERVVARDEGAALAEQYGANFLEVSAKTGHDVNAAFMFTVTSILSKVLDGTME